MNDETIRQKNLSEANFELSAEEKKFEWRPAKGIQKMRKKTLAGVLVVLGAVTLGTPSALADCATGQKGCDPGDEKKDHKGHGDYSFEFKIGPTITPQKDRADFGVEAHFSWIPDPSAHDKPHFEWTILDLGLSFYQISVNSGLPYNNKKSIPGTEFHFGTLANLVIPLGEIADLTLGGGPGVGFYYHGYENIGQDKYFHSWDVKANTQTAPLILLHGEFTFHVAEQVLVYGAYLPHFTLTPVNDSIPAHKHYHVDHTIGAGIGAMF
jgi:hypothetical protein